MSHVGICRRIGTAMLPRSQARLDNDGRGVGNGEGAVAHPTFLLDIGSEDAEIVVRLYALP
jgi:hypothetical protein